MLSADIERNVIKTVIGTLGVVLRSYGSTVEADIAMLRSGSIVEPHESHPQAIQSDDFIGDVHKILRAVFRFLQSFMSPLAFQ